MTVPGDFYRAIRDTLESRLGRGVQVIDYAVGVPPKLDDGVLLIEVGDSVPAANHADGRECRRYHVEFHCVLGRDRGNRLTPDLLDFTSAVEGLLSGQCWGLSSDDVGRPGSVHTYPSLNRSGDDGFEGRAVSFIQSVYVGDALYDDPKVTGVWLAENPDDATQEAEYDRLDG